MCSNGTKQLMHLALFVTVTVILVMPGAAEAQWIPWAGPTLLPDYIGAQAKAHPTANSGIPQNPNLAPNPFSTVHIDPWMSDVVDIAGPLGRNPEVLSSTLTGARQGSDSWKFQCIGITFDSHGHLVTGCVEDGLSGQTATVVLADARTLEVLDSYLLSTPSNPISSISAAYWYFDNQERFTIADGPNTIITLVEGGSEESPVFEDPFGDSPAKPYNLSGVIPSNDHLSGVMVDWQGRIWFATAGVADPPGAPAKVCVINPATYTDPATDLNVRCVSFGWNEKTLKNEQIFNTFPVTKTGVYIVTSEKMYRVWTGSDDQPYVAWSEPYDTVDPDTNNEWYVNGVKNGQYERGSGTSPTILGEGKYVAITDNAEPMKVVVFRTDESVDPNERKVCELPVFENQEGGALSNSLIGSRLSLIAENNYGYTDNWQLDGEKPSAPGFERIDINPNGKGCTKVWSNLDVASTNSGKLSTRTGLIYVETRKMDTSLTDAEHPYGLDVYYLTALDFRTGEVVWEKQVGTGYAFDHWYTGLFVGPDKTVYLGVNGGIVSVRDHY
jgi:hypothetical protein